MGEIKSTLDLVMERTRNLSMTAEERALQRQADFEKRLQGLLNKYAEEVLSVGNLTTRIEELKAELKITDKRLVVKAVFGRINPDADNARWLDLIAELLPSTIDPVGKILEAYRQKQTDLMQTCGNQMKDHLFRQHGIKGSSVIPNPLKDIQYQENIAALQDETRAKIETLFGQAS